MTTAVKVLMQIRFARPQRRANRHDRFFLASGSKVRLYPVIARYTRRHVVQTREITDNDTEARPTEQSQISVLSRRPLNRSQPEKLLESSKSSIGGRPSIKEVGKGERPPLPSYYTTRPYTRAHVRVCVCMCVRAYIKARVRAHERVPNAQTMIVRSPERRTAKFHVRENDVVPVSTCGDRTRAREWESRDEVGRASIRQALLFAKSPLATAEGYRPFRGRATRQSREEMELSRAAAVQIGCRAYAALTRAGLIRSRDR